MRAELVWALSSLATKKETSHGAARRDTTSIAAASKTGAGIASSRFVTIAIAWLLGLSILSTAVVGWPTQASISDSRLQEALSNSLVTDTPSASSRLIRASTTGWGM
jgi:hypothetical protein